MYRIDLSELSSSEAQTIDIDCSVKECIPSDSLIADHQDEKLTVKDVIYKKAKQLPMKIFKHKFTFIDSNFVSVFLQILIVPFPSFTDLLQIY